MPTYGEAQLQTPAAKHVPILLGGNQSRQRADCRQHRRRRHSRQHRRCRIGSVELSGCRRAIVRVARAGSRAHAGDVALLLECAARPGAGRNRAPRASSTISSMSRPAAVRGVASCPPWIRRSWLPARSPRPPISIGQPATSARCAGSRTRCTGAWTGDGRKTAARPFHMDGSRTPAFLRYRWQGYNEALILYVLGLGSPTHPLAHERAIEPGQRRIGGERCTATSFSTAARCSCISCLTSGSISAASRMRSCAGTRSTTSRTAGAPPFVNQQYAIRNPKGFRDYGQHAWGITASNGPGPATRRVSGRHAPLPWVCRARRAVRSG